MEEFLYELLKTKNIVFHKIIYDELFLNVSNHLNISLTLSSFENNNDANIHNNRRILYVLPEQDFINEQYYNTYYLNKLAIIREIKKKNKNTIIPIILPLHICFVFYYAKQDKFLLFDSKGFVENNEEHDYLHIFNYLFKNLEIVRSCYKLNNILGSNYSCLTYTLILSYLLCSYNNENPENAVLSLLKISNGKQKKMKKIFNSFINMFI